jgi:cytochrome d ubiquinol oxidase subunit II
MIELWFALVALTLSMYVVMDGFDLGAGVLHLLVARDDAERRRVTSAIGPYWDANEVWLLAAGGALFVAFPKVLSAGLSGFYLAIFLVIWCLLLRGISLEFRNHAAAPLWRAFWDCVFGVASMLLCIFFGCALGNLLRGFQFDSDGWFALTLFTDFSGKAPVGILDWYTVLVGVYALLALSMHGAAFLCWKTDGEVQRRSRMWAFRTGVIVTALWPVMTFFTLRVNPDLFAHFVARPLAWVFVTGAGAGLAFLLLGIVRASYRRAFLGSSAFLFGLIAATAAVIYPVMLRSIDEPALSMTAHAAANAPQSLRIAMGWWGVGLPLALVYFIIQFRIHRGKAPAAY